MPNSAMIPAYFRDLMDLSHVPRWTTHPVSRPQSVAEHSYRVAVIVMALAEMVSAKSDQDDGWLRATYIAMRWALTHDGPEARFGDIPAPVKEMVPQIDEIMTEQCEWFQQELIPDRTRAIVKIADSLEALSWVCAYGSALKDKFDREPIEHKLRRKVWELVAAFNEAEMKEAVQHLMGAIAP